MLCCAVSCRCQPLVSCTHSLPAAIALDCPGIMLDVLCCSSGVLCCAMSCCAGLCRCQPPCGCTHSLTAAPAPNLLASCLKCTCTCMCCAMLRCAESHAVLCHAVFCRCQPPRGCAHSLTAAPAPNLLASCLMCYAMPCCTTSCCAALSTGASPLAAVRTASQQPLPTVLLHASCAVLCYGVPCHAVLCHAVVCRCQLPRCCVHSLSAAPASNLLASCLMCRAML
jgi:hypothetical protein